MTRTQIGLLNTLDEYGYDIFSVNMLRDTKKLKNAEIVEALSTLTKSGLLVRLERGKYRRSRFTDEFVIANFLARDGGVAYWSALNYHGLTEQFPNIIFVQTALQKKISNSFPKIKFVKIGKKKLFGYIEKGIGNHKFRITDIEKTIIDCFDMPQHCGWYQEIIKGFFQADLSAAKMIKYCRKINNISIVKRLAYLTEILEKPKMEKFLSYAESILKEEYSFFEIGGNKKGKYISKWKLILNYDEEEILEIATS